MTKTIQELSDAELSRWIAEKLGLSDMAHAVVHGAGACSRCKRFLPLPERDCVDDYINDPAMTVMLLEKLRPLHVQITLDMDYFGIVIGWPESRYWRSNSHLTASRAVAEAFALANGWTE